MAAVPTHPNEEGVWTRLEGAEGVSLWQRERTTFAPVTMYYVIAPPRQSEILYDLEKARERYEFFVAGR